MGIYVNTNVSSLRGQQYLSNVNNSLNTTYQRLSSGLRINSAKDDAAGLNISDRLTSQINGLNQGNRNANDAIALAQTMEGGLDEITNMLQRIRTLAVQANNGINTTDDKKAIDDEARELTQEISRIAEQTTYGGKTILAGNETGSIFGTRDGGGATSSTVTSGTISFQIGANSGDTISMDVNSFVFSKFAFKAASTDGTDKGFATDGNGKVEFDLANNADSAIASIDAMIKYVDEQRSSLGAIQNRLESSIRVQSNVATNESDARSRIRDTDFAEESANLSQQSIIQQAATSMLMQANARPQIGLSLLG